MSGTMDIVEQLRKECGCAPIEITRAAADEIERLRAMETVKSVQISHGYIEILEEENERLREALQKYADPNYNGYNGGPGHAQRILADEQTAQDQMMCDKCGSVLGEFVTLRRCDCTKMQFPRPIPVPR